MDWRECSLREGVGEGGCWLVLTSVVAGEGDE